MSFPAIAHLNRTLRKFPVSSALETAGAKIGRAVGLTSGELVAAANADNIIGVMVEPASPEDQTEFTQGGGDGGAFTIDVHPGQALVAVAQKDATFIFDLYDTGAANQISAAASDVGVGYQIAVVDGVTVVEQTTTTPAVTVVSVIEAVPNGPGFARVEAKFINTIL